MPDKVKKRERSEVNRNGAFCVILQKFGNTYS